MAKSKNEKPASPAPAMFSESIADALIDAARINVMAAMEARPEYERPSIILPGSEDSPPNVFECLEQAMQWLNAARGITIELAELAGRSQTSIHVVSGTEVR